MKELAMNEQFLFLAVVAGWIATVVVGFIAAAIIYLILRGKIDLSKVLEEPTTTKASLSRLQFLIFTFVIALSLFLVIVGTGTPKFPEIPAGIFALLGISGGTYAVAKGVDANKAVESEKTRADVEKSRNV
jgi:glycerol uptake facilitator-like aquaporin